MCQLFNIVAIYLLLVVSLQYQYIIEAFSPSTRIQRTIPTHLPSRYFSTNQNQNDTDEEIDNKENIRRNSIMMMMLQYSKG